MNRRELLASGAAFGLIGGGAAMAQSGGGWVKLPTEPFRGKQDDVVFVDGRTGWYGNGIGRLFKTADGGQTWSKQMDRPGTFVRALGFVDARTGFLGNIGPDYFPNVSDSVPLYRTSDGGETWTPVEISGPAVTGVCAIDIHKEPFINAGVLDHRATIRAGGRVGGPAQLITSRDGGMTFASEDLSAQTAMITDVLFVSERIGFITGATDASVQSARALILRTDDGGRGWSRCYEGTRPWELTWKLSFPSPEIGYATVQSYNPDTTVTARVFAKSTDGGRTWSELPLADDHRVRAFGVGFVDADRGWIGAVPGGLETSDGGRTWSPAGFGPAVNKVRVVRDAGRTSVFAIGSELHRLDI